MFTNARTACVHANKTIASKRPTRKERVKTQYMQRDLWLLITMSGLRLSTFTTLRDGRSHRHAVSVVHSVPGGNLCWRPGHQINTIQQTSNPLNATRLKTKAA